MRALTYNLLSDRDERWELRLQQATTLLQAARPDILALNECTLLAEHDGAGLHALAAALDMQPELARAASGQHVALLIRGANLERITALQTGLAHAALVADLQLRGRALRVIVAHLDPYSAERRLQEVELLLGHVSGACLLLGDLNAISPRDSAHVAPERWAPRYRQRHVSQSGSIDTRALEALEHAGLVDVHASLHPVTAPTRPTPAYARADRPEQRLDYVFASAELASCARSCEPFAHPLARTASDHLPLYADFAW